MQENKKGYALKTANFRESKEIHHIIQDERVFILNSRKALTCLSALKDQWSLERNKQSQVVLLLDLMLHFLSPCQDGFCQRDS